MSSKIKITLLMGGMMLIMLPIDTRAQKQSLEDVLVMDIQRLGEMAVRDNVITEDRLNEIETFVRDSLPESSELKVQTLKRVLYELDDQYDEMIRRAQEHWDELGYIGDQMLPDRLYEPEDYVSPEEKRLAMEQAAVAGVGINMKELLKYVKPLPVKPWLMTTLRLLFGRGVSQRPTRWDYTVVPQMGGVYDIIMPGGRPDDSWRDAPKMYYDPHPDKHFRR